MLLSLEQAIETLLEEASVIKRTEMLALERAGGRILAEQVCANIDMPPFDRSPLDGYAFRAADSQNASKDNPALLRVVSEIPAGAFWNGELSPGEAVRLMTGAAIPRGADCVVKQEDTDDCKGSENTVSVYTRLKPWANYCFKGEDIKNGTVVAREGERLNFAHIGVLSAIGVSRVKARCRVTAGLLSTGDELTLPGEPLLPGKIYNSNIYMLSERMNEFGIDVRFLSKANDDVDQICAIIEREIDGVDIFVSTGGVSVGRRDCMHEVIERLGAKRLFWRIAIKPGTPALAAVYRGKLLLCLSGNPFAATSNFELLGRPVLARLTGDASIMYSRVTASMLEGFGKRSDVRRFVRAVCDGGTVCPTPHSHSSGAILSMLGCNSFIDIPAGNGGLHPGDTVEVVML